MIHVINGDLLESDCTVIGHQCNCFSRMDRGIAKQIKEKYPKAYQADVDYILPPYRRLGQYSYTHYPEKPLLIFNLYGQLYYDENQQTDYEALHFALDGMNEFLKINSSIFPIKIGFPYGMGAGLVGRDWNKIYEMIDKIFVDFDVYFYRN